MNPCIEHGVDLDNGPCHQCAPAQAEPTVPTVKCPMCGAPATSTHRREERAAWKQTVRQAAENWAETSADLISACHCGEPSDVAGAKAEYVEARAVFERVLYDHDEYAGEKTIPPIRAPT